MTAGRTVNTQSQSWCTPPKYVNAIHAFWNGRIALDPCSNRFSIVDADVEYSLPNQDGLKESWNFPTIFVNPPYGADRERGTTIKNWLIKCAQANREYGSEVIALIPVATNTSHWKTSIFGQADGICFLYDTRLRFLEDGILSEKGAPMACCLIYWGKRINEFIDRFNEFGASIDIRSLKGRRLGEVNYLIPNLFATQVTNTI